jgi:hypothetical protein
MPKSFREEDIEIRVGGAGRRKDYIARPDLNAGSANVSLLIAEKGNYHNVVDVVLVPSQEDGTFKLVVKVREDMKSPEKVVFEKEFYPRTLPEG